MLQTKAPTVAPKNKAGEKVPPKKPKPMQQLVKNNLKINNKISSDTSKFSVIIAMSVFVPNPKTSSKNNPIIPQNNPAIIGVVQGLNPNLLGNLLIEIIDVIKIIPITYANKPIIIRPNKTPDNSKSI